MDFHYFMAVFNEIVKKVDGPREKLTCTSTSTPQVMQRKW